MRFDETRKLLESNGMTSVTLRDEKGKGCLLIAPDLSARIMAVSMDGEKGENFGFVETKSVANRGKDPQFNPYGGALRWWPGPEGGQFGLAFPPGTKDFTLDSWHISEDYNGKRFEVAYPQSGEGTSALMGSEFSIENASGTRLHIGVESRISLLDDPLGTKSRGARKGKTRKASSEHFGYLVETTFENLSNEPMRKETGLVSIWMLGMYEAGPKAFVVAPFERKGTGTIVTDTYFSPDGISADRLVVSEKAGYLLFRADARERSKIGLSRSRAANTIGSIDFTRRLLTVWKFPIRRRMPYVNSLWEHQTRPYAGDITNSYNDDGNFGNFYELECSSHALALEPRERFCFPLEIHHYRRPRAQLCELANKLLGRRIAWGGVRGV
jgi:hypothetical protein